MEKKGKIKKEKKEIRNKRRTKKREKNTVKGIYF